MTAKQSKTQISFYRKLLIATLIDGGISTVPLLIDATGMGRRTIQETIKSLCDISVECVYRGATKSGFYCIADWGVINKKELKIHLQHITGVLECSLSKQLYKNLIEGIPMSDKNLLQAMFNQQRLQILSLGIHQEEFDDAYIFAWSEGVYPALSDTDGSVLQQPHECYKDIFKVNKEQVNRVIQFIDKHWLENKLFTFYELEDEFGGKWGEEFGRMSLIHICRYANLKGLFDDNVWNTLLTPGQHPTEAHYMKHVFNRKSLVDLM